MLCIVSKYHLQDGTENQQTNQQTKKTCDALLHHLLSAPVCLLQLSESTVVSRKTITTKSPTQSWLIYLFRKVNRVTRGHVVGLQNQSLNPTQLIFSREWRNFFQIELTGINPPFDWLANQRLVDWLIDWLFSQCFCLIWCHVFGLILFHQHCKRASSDSVVPPTLTASSPLGSYTVCTFSGTYNITTN